MVPLPNANGAHYDSVKSENTVSSKSIQMDVKIPVQPSNFDDLQKGALLGASIFMKHDKTYYYQPSYTVEFIPSPGTTLLSMDVNRRPFFFSKSATYELSLPLIVY